MDAEIIKKMEGTDGRLTAGCGTTKPYTFGDHAIGGKAYTIGDEQGDGRRLPVYFIGDSVGRYSFGCGVGRLHIGLSDDGRKSMIHQYGDHEDTNLSVYSFREVSIEGRACTMMEGSTRAAEESNTRGLIHKVSEVSSE